MGFCAVLGLGEEDCESCLEELTAQLVENGVVAMPLLKARDGRQEVPRCGQSICA